MVSIMRRQSLGLFVGGALALLAPQIATAQSGKPIEFVVPGAPGGGADIIARLVAQHASQAIGHQIIVVNKAGGGFVIGAEYVARAPADGLTYLVGTTAALSLQPLLRKTLPYKPSDFMSVAVLLDGPMALTINSAFGANTFQEFVAKAKSLNRPLRYATNGPGTLTHLYGMMLGEAMGFPVVDVAYRGNGPSTADLLAGHIDFGLDSPATTLGHVQAGKLKILALTYEDRAPLLPDVPTFKELGQPQLSATYWISLLAPAGSPKAMVDKINAAANAALRDPAIKERLEKEGLRPGNGGPEELDKRIAAETKLWGEMIKTKNIVLE